MDGPPTMPIEPRPWEAPAPPPVHPPGRGRRFWILAVVAIVAVAAIGGVVGVFARQGAVDKQHRRAVADEQNIVQLNADKADLGEQISALKATSADQASQIRSQAAKIAAEQGITQSCQGALASAKQALALSSQAIGVMSDALTAAGSYDIVGLENANSQLTSLTDQLNALIPEFQAEQAACAA